MGNCFSDGTADKSNAKESHHSSSTNTATSSHKAHGGGGGSGGTATGKGPQNKMLMSWAIILKDAHGTLSGKRSGEGSPFGDRPKYVASRNPADYEVSGLKPAEVASLAGAATDTKSSTSAASNAGKSNNNSAQTTTTAATIPTTPDVLERNNGYIPWVRFPGQINDQRINIDSCRKVAFLLLDQCDSIQVDDCEDCCFFIGPTTGSVFIRSVRNCHFIVACGQLRLRDAKNCSFGLFCQSRPVLESSSGIKIGPFVHRGYWELREQFAKAKLSIFNNKYTMVHDFTPKGGQNYSFIGAEDASHLVPFLSTFHAAAKHVSPDEEGFLEEDPVVPLTHGIGAATAQGLRYTFVVLFRSGNLDAAMELVERLDRAGRTSQQTQQQQQLQAAGTLLPTRSPNTDRSSISPADSGTGVPASASKRQSAPRSPGPAPAGNVSPPEASLSVDGFKASTSSIPGLTSKTPAKQPSNSNRVLLLSTIEQILTGETFGAIEAVLTGSGTVGPYSLKPAERDGLLLGGPTIGMAFACDEQEGPNVWRTFVANHDPKVFTLCRNGTSVEMKAFVETMFEKVALMGMGFGASH